MIEQTGEGHDHVLASISFDLGAHSDAIETLTLTGLAQIDGTGSDKANQITGNDAHPVGRRPGRACGFELGAHFTCLLQNAFPPGNTTHLVRLHARFNLDLREIEEPQPERGSGVSCETVRRRMIPFGP